MSGQLVVNHFTEPNPEWYFNTYPSESIIKEAELLPFKPSIRFDAGTLMLPHWLLVYLSGMLSFFAAMPSLSWRFTLRTLLITTTLVAVVLGLVVMMLRGS